ncbi:MAG: hypothetical protein FJ385_00505 [Verrucomicrobia bacterium]|nr:hypothetical protein [Verrucomicrobiota bacterium]
MLSGESATLSWSVTGADAVSISGIGDVAAEGSQVVSPTADTTYTLTATNAAGTKTRPATIRVKTLGLATYKYVRFTPTALRDPLSNTMQLAELQILSGTTRLVPQSTIANGSNKELAIDGNVATLWTKSNYLTGSSPGAYYVMTFAQPAAITGYRLGTAPDSPQFDPVSWKLEGSLDGFIWVILDEVTDSNLTAGRQRYSSALPVITNDVAPAGAPVINSFTASATTLKEGAATTLSWDVSNATAVSVTDVGTVAASGSASVSPSSTLTYYLVADNASGRNVASVTIQVNSWFRDKMIAEFDDAQYETFFDGSLASDLPSGEIFSTLDVGRLPGETTLRHIVVPFQLPSLGAGKFTAADLRLRVSGGILGAKGRTPIQLFGMSVARDSALLEATDVVDGALNHLTNGVLIKAGILNESTVINSFVDSGATGATSDAFAQWLNDAYANGANAGKYVFLRFSPNALTLPESFNFGVATGDDVEENVPTLSFAFDSDPAVAPSIGYFQAVSPVIESGNSTILQWGTSGGTETSIDQGVGTVAATGTLAVSPAETTTFTLTVGDGVTTKTSSATVTVAPVNSYRYLRFTGLGTRDPAANKMSISELQYYSFGTLLTGAVITPSSSNNSRLNDGSLTANWDSSSAPAPFTPVDYDFGRFVVPTTFRIGTNKDLTSTGLDPVAWRIQGSRDGQSWVTLDEQLNGASLIPTARSVLSDPITTIPGAPVITVTASAPTILIGESATLTWSATQVSEVTIDNGIGVQPATGSISVSPTVNTTYTVSAVVSGAGENLDGFNVTRSVSIRVIQGGLLATSYDSLPATDVSGSYSLFNPISGLLAQTPSSSFTQTDPINYNSTNWTTVPGLTASTYFSVLWQGVFDTSIDGTGQYTFGLNSNTGSVLYIDLNNDGDFADAGELVIDKNSYTVTQVQRTATVLLYNPNGYRIAIGYWHDNYGTNLRNFSAHFKKGNNVAFASLDTISGEFRHFKPTTVQPADSPAPEIAFSNTMQPIETVFRVASTATTSFTFSATNLQGPLTITAPTHFQVSNSGTGSWSSSVTQGAGGTFTGTVFVRIASSSGLPVAGPVSGNVTLSSTNAVSQSVAIPECTVLKRPGTITAVAASKTYGQSDPVFTYTKSSSVSSPPSGFNNNDPLTGALGHAAGENAGVYAMTLGTLTNPNYDITFVPADFTILPATLASADITLVRSGNAYTASAAGVSGFTISYVGRGETTYGPTRTGPAQRARTTPCCLPIIRHSACGASQWPPVVR